MALSVSVRSKNVPITTINGLAAKQHTDTALAIANLQSLRIRNSEIAKEIRSINIQAIRKEPTMG